MKNPALFSMNDKHKKINVSSAAILLGSLNNTLERNGYTVNVG